MLSTNQPTEPALNDVIIGYMDSRENVIGCPIVSWQLEFDLEGFQIMNPKSMYLFPKEIIAALD
jgi:hypothetical protein